MLLVTDVTEVSDWNIKTSYPVTIETLHINLERHYICLNSNFHFWS